MSIGIGIGLFLRSSAVAAVAAVIGTAWFSDPSLLASSTLPTMLAQYENDRYAVNGVEKTFHELHTFTRSTTKWVVGEAGTLIEVAIDEPAFDYSSGVREFLEEDQGQNLQGFSEDLTRSPWTKLNVTIDPNVELAPDGTTSMDVVIPSASEGLHYVYNNASTTVGVAFTQKIHVKDAGYSFIQVALSSGFDGTTTKYINFNLTDGTVGSSNGVSVTDYTINPLSTGGYVINITRVSDITSVAARMIFLPLPSDIATRLPTFTGDGVSGVGIWGADFKVGKPTSYIPTPTASSEIRAADNCKIDGVRFSDVWNAPIGTVYADYAIDYSATDTDVVSVNDGTANESLDLFFNSSGNSRLNITDGGVLQTDITGAIIPEGNSNKIAAAYKLNDSNLASNSVASTTDTSVTIPTVTQLEIAAGRYKEIRYYPVRVTDSEISRITSPYTIPSYLADVWGDLALWLDADTSVDDTITETAGAVSQWDDKSRESNHAIQAVGADQFTTGLEQINSLNVLASDGISDYMNAPLFGNDATVFFVISDQRSPLKASNVNTIIATQKGGAVPQQGWGVLAKPYSSTTERKLSNEGNGASTQFYVDGIAAGAGVNPSPPATIEHNTPFVGTLVSQTHTDRGEVAIGALRLGSNFGEHLFAEVVILNTTISDIAFNAIGNGLATKWGTTWADI